MLQEIVLAVCVLMQPTHCEAIHIQVVAEYGESLQVPFNCMKQGQIQAAKWIEAHPNRRVDHWTCPLPGGGRERI
jgi:hypothetical protein